MTKRKKILIFGGIVLILVLLSLIWAFTRNGSNLTFVTAQVEQGVLLQTVEVTGEIESVDKVDLAFNSGGIVDEIYFSVGDKVYAGDVLAVLDNGELSANARSAEQAVLVAEGNLNQELAGASDEVIAIYEADVQSANYAYSAAQIIYDNALASEEQTTNLQKIKVDSAKEDLLQAKDNQIIDLSAVESDLVIAMRSGMIASHSALSKADEILGINNRMANDDYQEILSALDSTALVNAKNAFNTAMESLEDAEEDVFVLSTDAEAEEIEEIFLPVENALQDTALTLLYTRNALDATAIDTQDFSADDLSALKTALDAERTSVQLEESALENSYQTFNNVVLTSTQEVTNAEAVLELAIATQSSELASAQEVLKNAEATLLSRKYDVAKAEVILVEQKAAPRWVDVAALNASVDQARATFDAALARLNMTQIISPINGTLSRFDIRVGEYVGASSEIITVQSVGEQYQIIAEVPEADILKIQLQDSVYITFDALGNDEETKGKVGKIDPAQVVVEGVTFYKVTVFLDEKSALLGLKPGMSADLIVFTEEKIETLIVPQRAVLEHPDGTKYVRVPYGTNFQEKIVTVGLRGDNGQLEIISGLEEGETIIVTIRDES